MIKYVDNIISLETQNHIEDLITSKYKGNAFPLHYTSNLTGEKQISKEIGFGCDFFNNNEIYHYGATLLSPLYIFLNNQNLHLKQLYQARTYLQIPSNCNKSKPQDIHTDLKYPHLVFLYYVTNSDGDTIFYDDNNSEIKRISPKKGRIAFFPGNIKHSGSTCTTNIRIILNINLELWN